MCGRDSPESVDPAVVITAVIAFGKLQKKSVLTRCENLAIPCSAAGRSSTGYGCSRIWK